MKQCVVGKGGGVRPRELSGNRNLQRIKVNV